MVETRAVSVLGHAIRWIWWILFAAVLAIFPTDAFAARGYPSCAGGCPYLLIAPRVSFSGHSATGGGGSVVANLASDTGMGVETSIELLSGGTLGVFFFIHSIE